MHYIYKEEAVEGCFFNRSLVRTLKYEVIGLTPDITNSKQKMRKNINLLSAVMKEVGGVEPVTPPLTYPT